MSATCPSNASMACPTQVLASPSRAVDAARALAAPRLCGPRRAGEGAPTSGGLTQVPDPSGPLSNLSEEPSRQARAGELRRPPQLAPGIYTLPVFSELFCRLLTEELAHFGASGLPVGQPNSMNRHGAAAAAETPAAKTTPPQPQRDLDCLCMIGALLDELGLSAGLLDPLLSDWLRPPSASYPKLIFSLPQGDFFLIRPLCAALPPLAAAGGASIDHHKARSDEIARDRPRSLDITRYHSRSPEITRDVGVRGCVPARRGREPRDAPRCSEIDRDHPRFRRGREPLDARRQRRG